MSRAPFAAAWLLLAACSPEEPAPGVPAAPVVVYAAAAGQLPALFERYTDETGVVVILRLGDAVVDDVIRNRISPPADLLLTPSVTGVYRAALDGALRPMNSPPVERRVPAALRDPDGFWAALGYRRAAVAWRPDTVGDGVAASFEALADPALKGKLCLSASSAPHNLTVIAVLIDRLGVREAELVARGWITNLARPVFAAEERLEAALRTGDCAVAVVSAAAAARLADDRGVALHVPSPGATDIDAVGIARHARNPDGALRLVEWLLREDVQSAWADGTYAGPAAGAYDGDRNVGLVGWHGEEAVRLAERARYP